MFNEYVNVKINKPLYDNYVCIRDIYINQAVREKKDLRIRIPQGVGIHNVQDWKMTGKVMDKEFKIKGNPMKLFCNFVDIKR